MIFERVLVGLDGSDLSRDACRLANRLRTPSGRLHALAVAEISHARFTGRAAPEWSSRLLADARSAREAVLTEFQEDPRVTADVTSGVATDRLLDAIADFDADLVAVGARGLGRAAGIVLGSVATNLIHNAPCSVLVTRGHFDARRFPRHVMVGIDGSEPAAHAAAVAHAVGDATGARVEVVSERVRPVPALVDASDGLDLLVVGSRGEHGVRSLGSVAERVAHEAHCPVLIVRNPSSALADFAAAPRAAAHS